MDWGIKLETVTRVGVNESLTLFHTDGTEYRSASVRWVLSLAIVDRSVVVSQWGAADDRTKEKVILEAMGLVHRDAWAYAVRHNISLDFGPAFCEKFPFLTS